MNSEGQWAWQSAAPCQNASISQEATVNSLGVNQVDGMCLGGGIYSISQENEFIEVKHKKMPRVNRWNRQQSAASKLAA